MRLHEARTLQDKNSVVMVGNWTVLEKIPPAKTHAKVLCKCSCGTEKPVRIDSLFASRGSKINKCCRSCARTIHGYKGSQVYKVWGGMNTRCYNKSVDSYKNYGGKGIIVCEAWHNFENFLRDMGTPPDGYVIDRIDPAGNYEKNNCRWVTPHESLCNKSQKTNTGETGISKLSSCPQHPYLVEAQSGDVRLNKSCSSLEEALIVRAEFWKKLNLI